MRFLSFKKGILFFSFLVTQALGSSFIELSKTAIFLNDSKKSDIIRLTINTNNKDYFFITVKSNDTRDLTGMNRFTLKPSLPNIEGEVLVAMNLPYYDRTTSGLHRTDSINRVINQQQTKASDRFSLCPTSAQVCKPLTIMVIDDSEAVPGIRYSASFSIGSEAENGIQSTVPENLTVNYQKSGSAIGIKTRTNTLSLRQSNDYSVYNDFCAFSMGYKYFDVSLESKNGTDNLFLLKDNNSNTLPYQVAVALNNRAKIPVTPFQWVTGGDLIRAKNSNKCNGRYNGKIFLAINKADVYKPPAGTYTDTLTLKVKAK